MNNQKKINDFMRKYADRSVKLNWGAVKYSGADHKHNKMLADVCLVLYNNGIPFLTEFKTNFGTRPDICCPTHVKKFIEIFNTEDDKKFHKKKQEKYPEELKDEFIFVDSKKELKEKMLQ